MKFNSPEDSPTLKSKVKHFSQLNISQGLSL